MKICAKCGNGFTCRSSRFCSMECSGSPSRNKRHGYAGTKIHATWLDMRNRCRNPKFSNYARYGGRGIKVCERWDVFENFLADMGEHPGGEYTLEREDNDGHYEPGNCVWATKQQQGRNRCVVWTPEQLQETRERLLAGQSYEEVAAALGKVPKAVEARAPGLGCGKWVLRRLRQSAQHTPTELSK